MKKIELLITNQDKKEFKLWIQALRSERFKQGRGALQPSHNEFCCLGVACTVVIPPYLINITSNGRLIGQIPQSQHFAPRWLRDVDEDFGLKTDLGSLAELNDSGEYSFDEIADLLELVYLHKILD